MRRKDIGVFIYRGYLVYNRRPNKGFLFGEGADYIFRNLRGYPFGRGARFSRVFERLKEFRYFRSS